MGCEEFFIVVSLFRSVQLAVLNSCNTSQGETKVRGFIDGGFVVNDSEFHGLVDAIIIK